MSPETDHPRQRIVAELLAEHGDSGAPGGRRREADDAGSTPGAAGPLSAGPGSVTGASVWSVPDRAVLRQPVPRDPARMRVEPMRERPTDLNPRVREDRGGVLDPGLTGPIDLQRATGTDCEVERVASSALRPLTPV